MTIIENGFTTTDHFERSNSATQFNLGYGQFPPGNYFNPLNYTFMIWMKVLSLNYYQRIIDFGNGECLNLETFAFFEKTNKIEITTCVGSWNRYVSPITRSISINKWIHFCVTSTFNKKEIYIDAVKILSYDLPQIDNVQTTKNYIGKSNFPNDDNVHAIFDEMKIFNRTLTIEQIKVEKEKKQPYKIILDQY